MNIQMTLFIDTDKLRKSVKEILTERQMTYEDLGTSIGYVPQAISRYMLSQCNSKFITAALIERFKLDPNEYMKEGFKE